MANEKWSDFRQSNEEAGVILFRRSNRLKLVEGLLFCATVFLFALLLQEACLQMAARLAKTMAGVRLFTLTGKLLFWGLLLFVFAPLCLGLLRMAARMANDEEVFLPDLFGPFSGGKAFGATLATLFPFYWKAFAFSSLPNILFAVLKICFGKPLWLILTGTVVLIVLGIVWLLLALRGFVRLSFLIQWRMPLLASGRANRQIAGKSFSGGGFWWICYLPRILLGFLTVGILLIADVIPRMLISYFRYAGRMTDYAFSSEEPNYE